MAGFGGNIFGESVVRADQAHIGPDGNAGAESAVPVGLSNQAGSVPPMGRLGAAWPAPGTDIFSAIASVTMPSREHPFNPASGTGADFYGADTRSFAYTEGSMPGIPAEVESAVIARFKNASAVAGAAGMQSDKEQVRTYLIYRTGGSIPNGIPLFANCIPAKFIEGTSEEVSDIQSVQMANFRMLEACNAIYAEAMATGRFNQLVAQEGIARLVSSLFPIGLSGTWQARGRVLAITGVTWAGKTQCQSFVNDELHVGDSVGFLLKFVPRAELVRGYVLNENITMTVPTDSAPHILQLVPHVVKGGYGELRPKDLELVGFNKEEHYGKYYPVIVVLEHKPRETGTSAFYRNMRAVSSAYPIVGKIDPKMLDTVFPDLADDS